MSFGVGHSFGQILSDVWRHVSDKHMWRCHPHDSWGLVTRPKQDYAILGSPSWHGVWVSCTKLLRCWFLLSQQPSTLAFHSNSREKRLQPSQWWRHRYRRLHLLSPLLLQVQLAVGSFIVPCRSAIASGFPDFLDTRSLEQRHLTLIASMLLSFLMLHRTPPTAGA